MFLEAASSGQHLELSMNERLRQVSRSMTNHDVIAFVVIIFLQYPDAGPRTLAELIKAAAYEVS